MSIGPFSGVQGSAAGAPLSQTKGSETEKNQQQASATQRKVDSVEKSEKASGIGTTEGDQQASDRDADGRRIYEDPNDPQTENPDSSKSPDPPKSKDTTGQSGSHLDLMG